MLLRQRDPSRSAAAVRVVGVIVRAAADAEAQRLGDAQVMRGGQLVVIGVVRLERIETDGGELREPLVVFDQDRMRQRGNAAGGVDALEHFRGRCANSGDECRTAARQPPVERLGNIRDVARVNQRAKPRESPSSGIPSDHSRTGYPGRRVQAGV